MKDFWGFYQNLHNIENPFQLFGLAYFIYFFISFLIIYIVIKKYKKLDLEKKMKWQKAMACYFFIEEFIYYSWIFVSCKENLLFELISLELCTFCAWMNASTFFHQNKQVRFFSVLVGMIGGIVAIVYPANVVDIYPVLSYRLVNFYMLHGAFILFALMILFEKDIMSIPRLKKNILIVMCMFVCVFFFNLVFETQYMFVGTPPTIPVIHMVYEFCGKLLFLPMILCIVSIIQALVYFIIKKIQSLVYSSKKVA